MESGVNSFLFISFFFAFILFITSLFFFASNKSIFFFVSKHEWYEPTKKKESTPFHFDRMPGEFQRINSIN